MTPSLAKYFAIFTVSHFFRAYVLFCRMYVARIFSIALKVEYNIKLILSFIITVVITLVYEIFPYSPSIMSLAFILSDKSSRDREGS